MPTGARQPAYKEVTHQQLRSFCETARLGSLKGAADALGLSHPTVWQQVHALERQLGVRLIEPHGRGCRLTAEGRLLAEMASSVVAGLEALPRSFAEARAQTRPRLRVAATQRTLIEDLPEVILAFGRRHPEIDLCLQELGAEHVIPAVQSGDADLGVTTEPDPSPVDPALLFEEGYRLDLMLVTRRDHPLARRRSVRPADLCGHPLVNAPNNIPDPGIAAMLDKLGLFRTQPRRVEAYYTATIRRFVELGFGIGLVVGRPRDPRHLVWPSGR